MSSVTFGSVGDIITVCLLAKSVVEALNDSRGSTAEYQGLITEIRSLECSLLELELFTRSRIDSSTPESLRHECSKLVMECRKTLEAFQAYLKKYDYSLSKDTRTGILRRAGAKIKWQLLAKDTLARFRSELAGHSNALNMMMITTNVMISLKGLDTQKASASSTECILAGQDEELATLSSEIRNNSALASSVNSAVRTMSQQFHWFTNLLVSVKSMLSQGFKLNLATYRAVLSIQDSIGHSMDRTLIQDPFVLEDPLGRVAPVHLQFITSWKAFYAVLITRFEGLPGQNKIERREFVLQERATSREISGEDPWEIAFRPGSSILMSLVFRRDAKTTESKSHCPYCGNISDKNTADDVHCIKCNLIYRRVTEITDVDQPTIPAPPNHWSRQPSFGRAGFNEQPLAFGPFPKRKRTMENWEEISLSEEVRSFKRVRILSKIKKARRTAFASWEEKASWATRENAQVDIVAGIHSFETKPNSTAETGANFKHFREGNTLLSSKSFFSRAGGQQSREKGPAHIFDPNEEGTSAPKKAHAFSREKDQAFGPKKSKAFGPKKSKAFGPKEHIRDSIEDAFKFDATNNPMPFEQNFRVPLEADEPDKPDQPDEPNADDTNSRAITNVLLLDHYATRLSVRRAQLLQFLPGGLILSPIPQPSCQVLDIGPPDAWTVIATRHMPKAHIQNVQTWDHQTSRDLFQQLDNYETENYDLIHMQDWTVAANFLLTLPRELYRILRPGGWIEIEILQLWVRGSSCVGLYIYPYIVRHSFRSIGIKGFSTAQGIAKSLEDAYFTNVQSTVQSLPPNGPSKCFNGEVFETSFKELWLLVLELVEKLADAFSEPQRSSRLSMIREMRAALSHWVISGMNSMDLVRITAQKPGGQSEGQ